MNLREPSAPAAIAGSYADYKFVKTRSVIQIIIEVPVEYQQQVFDALGFPIPGKEVPVAVARLDTTGPMTISQQPQAPDRGNHSDDHAAEYRKYTDRGSAQAATAKARYAAMTAGEQAVQRAGMLPQDERFRAWATEQHYGDLAQLFDEADAATYIRDICCGGNSRSRIAENPEAMDRFIALETAFKIAVGEIAEPR